MEKGKETDGQTEGQGERWLKWNKKWDPKERWWEHSGRQTLFGNSSVFLFFKTSEKTSADSARSVTSMVIQFPGSEEDGLVHFYCLVNAPNSPACSSIIHSLLLFPSILCPYVLSFLLPNSPFPILRSFCRFSTVSPQSWGTLKMNGHGASHRILP